MRSRPPSCPPLLQVRGSCCSSDRAQPACATWQTCDLLPLPLHRVVRHGSTPCGHTELTHTLRSVFHCGTLSCPFCLPAVESPPRASQVHNALHTTRGGRRRRTDILN